MMRRILLVVFALGMGSAYAQFGRSIGDWMTSGADAQRSFWIRTDPKISRESLSKPGFEFLWKVKLGAGPQTLTEPVLLDKYIGYRGFRSLGFMGSASNGVFAVDTDLARIEWQKQLSVQPTTSSSGRSAGCGASYLAEVTRPTTAEIPAVNAAPVMFGGRGGPARSGVGDPHEGAVTLAAALTPRTGGPPPFRPPTGKRPAIVLHALSSDGMLHTMYVSNGEEPEPAIPFLPPNTGSLGLIAIDNVAYAVVDQACGKDSGLWALDLGSKQVTKWTGAGVAGSAGAAIGPDGTMYVATGAGTSKYSSSIVALAPKTLEPNAWYTASQPFASSPVLFQHRDKTLLAAATKDGSLHLVDTGSLGGGDNRSPVARTEGPAGVGTLTSWQDRAGTRWFLAPSASGIAGWKIVDENGAVVLRQAWKSREMVSPGAPLIVNSVAFAMSGNVVYALDATTGKELWNSGNAIPASVNGGALSVGGGQLYVTASDGVLYAFGFWMEH